MNFVEVQNIKTCMRNINQYRHAILCVGATLPPGPPPPLIAMPLDRRSSLSSFFLAMNVIRN